MLKSSNVYKILSALEESPSVRRKELMQRCVGPENPEYYGVHDALRIINRLEICGYITVSGDEISLTEDGKVRAKETELLVMEND